MKGLPPPPLIKEQLLAKFAERREDERGTITFGLPQRMKEKILSHLLVLALVLDDFTVESLPLQKDLRITSNKCVS